MSEDPAIQALKADYETVLVNAGLTLTWQQRTVTGQDKNGNDIPKFTNTTIQAFIRGVEPMEVRLIEPGFVLEQYLVMTTKVDNDLQILDRILYEDDIYEVRADLPAEEALTKIMRRVRLRMISTPIPPGG